MQNFAPNTVNKANKKLQQKYELRQNNINSDDHEPGETEAAGPKNDRGGGHRHQVRGRLHRRLHPLPLGHRASDLLPALGYVVRYLKLHAVSDVSEW